MWRIRKKTRQKKVTIFLFFWISMDMMFFFTTIASRKWGDLCFVLLFVVHLFNYRGMQNYLIMLTTNSLTSIIKTFHSFSRGQYISDALYYFLSEIKYVIMSQCFLKTSFRRDMWSPSNLTTAPKFHQPMYLKHSSSFGNCFNRMV